MQVGIPIKGLLNQYLLLLQPHTNLTQQIMELKKTFAKKYKTPEAAKAKPHITLVAFAHLPSAETRIIHTLNNIAHKQVPIKIELQNFGSFPSHTIYINVTTKTPIQNLVKNIRTETQKIWKIDKEIKPHYILESHITIARRLQPWQYEQAWLEYSHTAFTGKFVATNMILLRKTEADKYWQTIAQLHFNEHPITIQQTQLF
jgi:2'-5' RNA ligase